MSEQNIIEIRLTDEQRVAFAAVLRASHLPGSKHQAAILTVLTDSYVPLEQCGVLRLQVALVEWKVGEKVAKLIAGNALPIDLKQHFT